MSKIFFANEIFGKYFASFWYKYFLQMKYLENILQAFAIKVVGKKFKQSVTHKSKAYIIFETTKTLSGERVLQLKIQFLDQLEDLPLVSV